MPELGPAVEDEARSRLGPAEADAFLTRLETLSFDITGPLGLLYGGVTDVGKLATELVLDALDAAAARPPELRRLDRRREIDPAWFQRSRMIGYVCYADRFAGSLRGVREHLDYLVELGVSYLHLMPLLRPREGESDGGYAVADYGQVDPRVGTMDDLQALAADLHERGIALCVDLVLNHTAREHEWARKAVAGEPGYREMYLVYPDRTEPDAYERTLPEVFPDIAPGSFTEVPGLGWVWTSFHEYQWDLNYANPAVFRAMLGTMLDLANRGIDVLRLDAAPFLWKRMGTDCQNQPEAHLLLQAFRALTRLAAPGLVLKAEAIVSPEHAGPVPGRPRQVPPGMRPGLRQPAHGHALVEPGHPRRPAGRAGAVPAPARARADLLGHLRPLPRRHRLGGVRPRRRRGGRRRLRPPAVPGRLLRRRFSRLVRPRRPVPGQPGHRRRPHLRHGRVAVRHRGGARGRRSRRLSSPPSGGWSRCTPSPSPSAASRSSTWATSWPCATTRAGSRTRRTRTTTGGCTGR